ncbi:hypothetical protein G4G28_14075 [Massilia sp. Dwa41.01b]|uniref:hypothetical protein n=1 Tax=unclassified Massilia TaxID=2609279 RepID=UPI00160115B3|nr:MULTISPECIES: hypothetical protein [unclassified Massilia]QNA89314.1 hypothetical protein G4G28_14075 [Massilia sp. Dwa41.01b]QNB00213.1 hypothetical protein G4G31_17650 [Massilia sp. Se16.2.3]
MRRKNDKVRPSKLAIDPRIFVKARGETDALVRQRILVQLKHYSFHGRFDLISEVASYRGLPASFNPLFPTGTKFHGAVHVYQYVSPAAYPHWLFALLQRNCSEISKFLKLRAAANAKVLLGDSDGALNVLEEVGNISQSWWGTEYSIHIRKELRGEDTKKIIKELPDQYPHLALSNITKDMLLLSEPNSVNVYVNTVLGRLKEYRSSSISSAKEHGAVESCDKLPISYDPGRTPKFAPIRDYSDWSILDQYMLWRSIVMDSAARNNTDAEWIDATLAFAESVGDTELINAVVVNEEIDPGVSEILASYTRGEYEVVIALIRQAINEGRELVVGLIELYARAKVYCGIIGDGHTFYDAIANEFAKILVLDPIGRESGSYLRRICIKFRREPWAKSLIFHLSLLQGSNDLGRLELLRRQTQCLGRYNTPKARGTSLQSLASSVVPDSVPDYRVLRYASGIDDVHSIEPSLFPIYSDYLVTKSSHLLAKNRVYDAAAFFIDEYLKNSLAFDHMPVNELCSRIIEHSQSTRREYVLSMVVLDICSKEQVLGLEDRKSELFEEFLEHANQFQPSKVFEAGEVNCAEAYFLRYICVPAQLDNIIEFQNNDEVIHERVAIIDFLIAARAGNADELRAERDKVLETLFSEKLRAKIETGKLYVDVQALEVHRRHIYMDLYEKAKSIEGGVSIEPLDYDWDSVNSDDLFRLQSDVPVAVPLSKKVSILVRIFVQATKDFALNENYGLDKYLSAEVRHTVFVSQLRACFEKNNLVTLQKDGEYLSNIFWIHQYSYVTDDILVELDNILRIFSREVDGILLKVNEQFRVKLNELSPDHIFDFCPYHDRAVRVSQIVDSSKTFDEFFTALIGFMWELAVESARAAQQLINDVLAVKVLEAIDLLESAVQTIKGEAAMFDLMQAIRNARSDFKKEVELVLNWFRFVGSEQIQSFEKLGVVIEAAVSSFQSIFEHKGKILIFQQDKTNLSLSYGEARSLFISLFTGLENALKYGALDSPVEITHKSVCNFDEICIINSVSPSSAYPEDFAASQRAKWTEENSALSRAEGGSGIYKMHNLLTNSSTGFDFDISVSDDKFGVIVRLNHENFINRG